MTIFCRSKRGSKSLKEKKSIVGVILNELYKTQSQIGQNSRVPKVVYARVIEKMRETYQKVNTEHEFEDEKLTYHAKKTQTSNKKIIGGRKKLKLTETFSKRNRVLKRLRKGSKNGR